MFASRPVSSDILINLFFLFLVLSVVQALADSGLV
jgi:hypothetical protein